MKRVTKTIFSVVIVTYSVTMYASPVFAGPIGNNFDAVEQGAQLPPCPSMFRCRVP